MDAPQLAALLASGDDGERAQAYAELEATDDAALAAASVAPLAAVFARPVEEIDAAELHRAGLALGRLVSLDCVVVGGEWLKEGRWLIVLTSEGNALNAALRKPVDELTREDALLCAACDSVAAAYKGKGFDPVLAVAGLTPMEFMGLYQGASPYAAGHRRAQNCRLSTLLVEALREEREQMAEGLVAGAWMLLSSVAQTRPAVAQHQIELGCLSLAVAELRTMDSSEWVHVSRSPLGLPTSVFNMLGVVFTSLPDPGTPGLLEVCLDALTAYERAGASGDTGALVLYNVMCVLVNGRLYSQSDANAAQIRGAAASIRFLLDNPQSSMKDVGASTGTLAGFTVAEVFGRDEGGTMEVRQADIDDMARIMTLHMTGELLSGSYPIQGFWSEGVRNLSVSDGHKTLLLRNSDTIPLLLAGLFLDADHPRGLRAQEILGPAASPTPVEIQAEWQQNYTEALAQLALFPAGKETLLADDAIVPALEAVVERGMTDEAKEFARNALISLRGFADPSHDPSSELARNKSAKVVPEHIMLSYEWSSQPTIVRTNSSLKRRGYITWLDTEQMKGSIMVRQRANVFSERTIILLTELTSVLQDAMSNAVEGAEVILYGVSKRYKESANCRLEANYGHQQE